MRTDIIDVSNKTSKQSQLLPKGLQFRASGIYGRRESDFDNDTVFHLGKAFYEVYKPQTLLLAHDANPYIQRLLPALTQALSEEGVQIKNIGLAGADEASFGVVELGLSGGIQFCASNTSPDYLQLRFYDQQGNTIPLQSLEETYGREHNWQYLPLPENNAVLPTTVRSPFLARLQEVVQKLRGEQTTGNNNEIALVIDAGNGTTGDLLRELAGQASWKLHELYFEAHADYPHHLPDPLDPANLNTLSAHVKERQAALGVAVDADGDSLQCVDEQGEIVSNYHLGCLLAEYIMQRQAGGTILHDVRYTLGFSAVARATSTRAVYAPTGHQLFCARMRQEEAVFGAEPTSGHFYYKALNYADSAALTIALVVEIMRHTGRSLSELVASYRNRFPHSPEISFVMPDSEAFAEVRGKLQEQYPTASFSDFDGFSLEYSDWRLCLRQAEKLPILRLTMEANSAELLEQRKAAVAGLLAGHGTAYTHHLSLPELADIERDADERLQAVISNLLHTWKRQQNSYLDHLYQNDWTISQTPLDLLRQIDQPLLDRFFLDNSDELRESERLLRQYLDGETWFDRVAKIDPLLGKLRTQPIAYFSLEFGLVDWLQIYSGGLGILAGDTIKEASDSGVPLVGIGLFYSQGFFYQRFDNTGWQVEDYMGQDADDYPFTPVRDAQGYTITVSVPLGDHEVKVRAWQLQVGRRSLVLLDTNISENANPVDRMITYHLYGGDQDTRIRQELVLAIGGYRILQALGIEPSVLHLNEGHSAFALLALAADLRQKHSYDFQTALAAARKRVLFTNHTLKQAGNDVFPYALVEKYLGGYAQEFGVEFRELFALGVDPLYADGQFGMTIMGLNNAARINAVSELHARAAKDIWPNHELIPVTNGVHLPTWVSPQISWLVSNYVSEHWDEQGIAVDWKRVERIPSGELWKAHLECKNALREKIRENSGVEVPENAIIFSWFRRFTAYKQPEILILDLDRLTQFLEKSPVPVVFAFGGKAHPRDREGKSILQRMWQLSQEPRFRNKLILLEDYNWQMARYMVSGSDVWINSPVRYQEACGTSGMKAGANGVLQFSTYDGWVDEIRDRDLVWEIKDELDAESYFHTLENEILPMFLERNAEGIPERWVERMRQTISGVFSHYGTNRMLRDYVEKLYRPILKDCADE